MLAVEIFKIQLEKKMLNQVKISLFFILKVRNQLLEKIGIFQILQPVPLNILLQQRKKDIFVDFLGFHRLEKFQDFPEKVFRGKLSRPACDTGGVHVEDINGNDLDETVYFVVSVHDGVVRTYSARALAALHTHKEARAGAPHPWCTPKREVSVPAAWPT